MKKKESQADRLLRLLSDGQAHDTLEIRAKIYGNEQLNMARIASRVNDLKKRGHEITGEFKNGLYTYTLGNPPKPKPKMQVRFEIRNGVETAVLVPELEANA